jgi:hypothetical protein
MQDAGSQIRGARRVEKYWAIMGVVAFQLTHESCAGDAKLVPGSNAHLFEHFAPPQPYGMDNRRDPPYDTSFHGMGFGSDGR